MTDREYERTPEPFHPLGVVGECPNCDGRVYSNEHGGVCHRCGAIQPKFVDEVEHGVAARALALPPETDVPLPEPQTRAERCADLARWYGEQAVKRPALVGEDGELISEMRLAIRYALDALGRDEQRRAA